ncbi:MAG: type II toxin-antitoxin system RelE/ParE family toxin [Candidatus Omnitrophota bacterium]
MYKVVYLDQVEQDLRVLDKGIIRKILSKIEKYLAQDPKKLGKALKGDFDGYWRYRWGDYRVIYRIAEKDVLILVLRIAHRKDVYQSF